MQLQDLREKKTYIEKLIEFNKCFKKPQDYLMIVVPISILVYCIYEIITILLILANM